VTLEELYRLLRSGHVQAQGIVDTLQEPLLVLDRNLIVSNANPSFLCMFNVERDETLGKSLFSLGNGQWDIPELRTLLTDVVPRARAIIGFEVDHEFPEVGRRTIVLSARRLKHPDENSSEMLLVFDDVTERRRADAEKDLLLAETRHRMKNLAAILHAVATQTGTEGRTAQQYREIFLGRFYAVINAQVLVSANGSSIDLATLIEQTLRPLVDSRVEITAGPSVTLVEHQLLPLSMALHELATNAMKYGALSAPSGMMHVTWRTEDRENEECLLLDWREEGGPTVEPPTRDGFGMTMIKNGISGVEGQIALDFAPGGLCAQITLPLAG
jgi:two-component sensor histidine kinase